MNQAALNVHVVTLHDHELGCLVNLQLLAIENKVTDNGKA